MLIMITSLPAGRREQAGRGSRQRAGSCAVPADLGVRALLERGCSRGGSGLG